MVTFLEFSYDLKTRRHDYLMSQHTTETCVCSRQNVVKYALTGSTRWHEVRAMHAASLHQGYRDPTRNAQHQSGLCFGSRWNWALGIPPFSEMVLSTAVQALGPTLLIGEIHLITYLHPRHGLAPSDKCPPMLIDRSGIDRARHFVSPGTLAFILESLDSARDCSINVTCCSSSWERGGVPRNLQVSNDTVASRPDVANRHHH